MVSERKLSITNRLLLSALFWGEKITQPRLCILLKSYEEFDNDSSVQRLVRRMTQRGYLRKIEDRGGTYYGVTEAGQIKLGETPQKIRKANRKWDGQWRMVIYDIPDRVLPRRNHLRGFLRRLGFGKLQESCWISPYDFIDEVIEYCEAEGINNYICYTEGKLLVGMDDVSLAKNVWKLDLLEKNYNEFISKWRLYLNNRKNNSIFLPHAFYEGYKRWRLEFSDLLFQDPFLPDQLMKEGWPRDKAGNVFKEVWRMTKLACRHIHPCNLDMPK